MRLFLSSSPALPTMTPLIPINGPIAKVSAKNAKRQRLSGLKRRATVIKKLDELHTIGYEVYTLLQKGFRTYVYKSNGNAVLPPTYTEVV
jgi:hypothetical protein